METVLASANGEINETIFSSIFTDEFIASVESLLTKKESIIRRSRRRRSRCNLAVALV